MFRSPSPKLHSHFPADRQQSYFEHLLSEVLVTTYSKGQPVREWRPKKGVRHEALDVRVYAYAALRALVSMARATAGICVWGGTHGSREGRNSKQQLLEIHLQGSAERNLQLVILFRTV